MKTEPDDEELLLHAPVTVLMGVVKIEIDCRDDYQAQVLFDDLVERLGSGQSITIEPALKR